MERPVLKEIGQNSPQQQSQQKENLKSTFAVARPSKEEESQMDQNSIEKENSSILMDANPQLHSEITAEEIRIPEGLATTTSTPKLMNKNLIGDDRDHSFCENIVSINRQLNMNDSKPFDDSLGLLSKNFGSMGIVDNYLSNALTTERSNPNMTLSDDEDFEECHSFNDLSVIASNKTFDGAVTITKTEQDSDFDFSEIKNKSSDELAVQASDITVDLSKDASVNTTIDILPSNLTVNIDPLNKTVEIQNANEPIIENDSSAILVSGELNLTVNSCNADLEIIKKTPEILPEQIQEQIGLTEAGDAGWTNFINEKHLTTIDKIDVDLEGAETEEPVDLSYRADSLEPEPHDSFCENVTQEIINDHSEPSDPVQKFEDGLNFSHEQMDVDSSLVSENSCTSQNSKSNTFINKIENSLEVEFKFPSLPMKTTKRSSMDDAFNPFDGSLKTISNNSTACAVGGGNFEDEFKSAAEFQFSGYDFDYLQQFGNSQTEEDIRRDSVLLKFDPLFKQPVLSQQSAPVNTRLSIPLEEEEHFPSLNSEFLDKINEDKVNPFEEDSVKEEALSFESELGSFEADHSFEKKYLITKENYVAMNEMKDLILETTEHNGNSLNHSNHFESGDNKMNESQDLQQQGYKMAEMEKKIKSEVLKSEDIEKKLKEAELREETLLKRITEKDKTISKMSGVVEAYEKAIAELIAEKEQLVQSYEKKCTDLKMDGEMNAQHLGSLETTFSDLHAKYERTKQVAAELKEREDKLLAEKKQNAENLKMQEMRYEKMKTHAMAQLETANNKLAELTRNHSADLTKLRAQLKKEEISRASTTEQLLQKSKENEELVKICDELINGGQTS